MNKHLLFIPFIALLGTSCNGGAITTTPVVKNAPSASLKHPKQGLATPPDMTTNQITFSNHFVGGWTGDAFFRIDTGANVVYNQLPLYIPCWRVHIETDLTRANLIYPLTSSSYTTIAPYDYIKNFTTNASASWWTPSLAYAISPQQPLSFSGTFYYYPNNSFYNDGYEEGHSEGYEEGLANGYIQGYEEGEAYNNPIIHNGQYAGLTAFPRRHFLEILARRVVSGLEQLQPGHFDLIDTNANYTIYVKWSYSYPKTTFQDYGNEVIGELYWTDIISGNWSTSWFGKYDPELHKIVSSPKYYATDNPVAMSFYPEVYLGSTIVGDVNYYFMGTANDYALGFADGQTYTIQASETYNNVFTIFTPAFRAVANFFNLNIGPFKIWYFFAIPLIVSLLILVLRLVKH